MANSVELKTKDLTLRHLLISDAHYMQKYAGDASVSKMTLYIPHPYEDGMAEDFIKSVDADPEKSIVFGIISKTENHLIGCIGLTLDTPNKCADVGYWIGKPFWGKGYCTQALRKVLEYCFETIGLNCVSGHHFSENPASGKVLLKCGMQFEGKLRQRKIKNGEFKDMVCYSILKTEYESKEVYD